MKDEFGAVVVTDERGEVLPCVTHVENVPRRPVVEHAQAAVPEHHVYQLVHVVAVRNLPASDVFDLPASEIVPLLDNLEEQAGTVRDGLIRTPTIE
ncbi:hypothetical protein [Rhodopseudomonas sp. B29]|uniref:hypothetical protein n=1 Tax=Rhodopseudomonas sp. B29 TaxID=95607 RepID=UPI0011D2C640|nr:hypothetical protein [Rhodopseudomonas sp. B29]